MTDDQLQDELRPFAGVSEGEKQHIKTLVCIVLCVLHCGLRVKDF